MQKNNSFKTFTMQTTGKYNEILKDAQVHEPAPASNYHQQAIPASTKMDRALLEAEVKTIIKRAYEANEPGSNKSQN